MSVKTFYSVLLSLFSNSVALATASNYMTVKWKTAGCSQCTQLITQVPTCPNPLHHLLQVILHVHHLSCLTLCTHSHHSQCLPLYPITLSLSCQSLMNLPFSISHESSSVQCLPLTLLSLSLMETQATQLLTLTLCKYLIRIINKFTSCLFFQIPKAPGQQCLHYLHLVSLHYHHLPLCC